MFLHCDRYIEIHAAYGKYYRLRIPRFGRDMKYHYPSCDTFIVGDRSVLQNSMYLMYIIIIIYKVTWTLLCMDFNIYSIYKKIQMVIQYVIAAIRYIG